MRLTLKKQLNPSVYHTLKAFATAILIVSLWYLATACHHRQDVRALDVGLTNCEEWSVEEVEAHIMDFVQLWRCYYQEVPPIEGAQITCKQSVTVASCRVGGRAVGERISVQSMPLTESAVWHELAHLSLLRLRGDADETHSDKLVWRLVDSRHQAPGWCQDVSPGQADRE